MKRVSPLHVSDEAAVEAVREGVKKYKADVLEGTWTQVAREAKISERKCAVLAAQHSLVTQCSTSTQTKGRQMGQQFKLPQNHMLKTIHHASERCVVIYRVMRLVFYANAVCFVRWRCTNAWTCCETLQSMMR